MEVDKMRIRFNQLLLSCLFVVVGTLLVACASGKPISSEEYNVNKSVSSSTNISKQPNVMTSNNPNQPVSSLNNSSPEPSVAATSELTIIEGKITLVMETFPLQLMVETKKGVYAVGLLPETRITQKGKTVDAGKLTPNLSVKIQGQLSNSNQLAMNAQVIEIK
jgi:hypothetical protein